jgi:hypothetical protein
MGANKTYQQKGDKGRMLGESDEFNAGPARDLTPPFGKGYKKIIAQIVRTCDAGRSML